MQRPPVAIVVRHTTPEQGPFAIRDLSAGGARLVGELRPFEGERVRVRIELATPVELAADVTRVDVQRKVVEVAFRDVTPDVLAQIESAVQATLAKVRDAAPPTVLIIHPTVDVSSALERDLARIGVAARVSAKLDDVEWLLQDSTARFVGAILSGSFGEDLGPQLEHIERHHPKLARVVLFGDRIVALDHPALGRVHAVLRTPWRFKGLARALDVPTDKVVTTYDQLVALKQSTED